MSYTKQLDFVRELLGNMNISSHIAVEPQKNISKEIDLGLRALLFDASDYRAFLENSMSEARSNTIYRFFDEYYCNYIFMRLPDREKETYFFIGPYLFQLPEEEVLREKFRNLGLSGDVMEQVQQYYTSLPMIEDENLVLTVASTLGQTIWGSADDFSVEYINYVIPDRKEPLPVASYPGSEGGQKFPLTVLEKNYANEKRLMEAVSQGKLHKINVIASTVFNNGTEPRLSDSLRNRKNYLVILKTLLRKAAEQGGVHPLHIHKMSSHYANEIEKLRSVKESFALQEEMIRSYCLLVKQHSLNRYSAVVGKAITMIHYDLNSDLSLKAIAEQLNVSPAYFSGLFKKECGCTLTEYVNKMRVEQAISLLRDSEKQIQNIAYESGFQDPNYFIRQFKRQTGMTPGEYRRSISLIADGKGVPFQQN